MSLNKTLVQQKSIKNIILLLFLFLFLNSCVTNENVRGYSTSALCDFLNPWLYLTTAEEKKAINSELSRRSVTQCGGGNQARIFNRSSFLKFYNNAMQSGYIYFAIVANDTRWEVGASSKSSQQAINIAFKQCISNDCVLVHVGPPDSNTSIYDESYLSRKMKENEKLQQAKIETENKTRELQEKRQKEADEESKKIAAAEKRKKTEMERNKKLNKQRENLEKQRIAKLEKDQLQKKQQQTKQINELVLLGTGTGFFINDYGYLVSNAHVMRNCKRIDAIVNGKSIPVNLESYDDINDLAVGKVAITKNKYISLGKSISLAEDILVFGFPLISRLGTSIKATKGIISSLSGPSNDSSIIQFDASIQKGNSGGPIVNDKSQLVGVTVATNSVIQILADTQTIPQNINYGIKVQTLKLFLESNNVEYYDSKNKKRLQNKEIASRVSDRTFLVGCFNTREVKNKLMKEKEYSSFLSTSDSF